jgi:hypothetical protein
MTENNIKFVVVGRPSDQALLGAEAPDSIKKTFKQEVWLIGWFNFLIIFGNISYTNV